MKTKVNICHRIFGAKLEATEEGQQAIANATAKGWTVS